MLPLLPFPETPTLLWVSRGLCLRVAESGTGPASFVALCLSLALAGLLRCNILLPNSLAGDDYMLTTVTHSQHKNAQKSELITHCMKPAENLRLTG